MMSRHLKSSVVNRPSFLIIVTISVFLLSTWTRNIFLFRNFCFHTYDIGLDIEAIQNFARGAWNGFLSVRQTTYFLDHWEPVVALVSPLSWVVPLPYMAFFVESSFLILTALVIWKMVLDQWK